MQGVVELLAQLKSLGVRLSVESGQLSCNAPKGVLTAELQASIRENKFHLIAFLSENRQNVQPPVQPLLSESERKQLQAWNETKQDYGPEVLLQDLFEQQVERTPEAVAVEFEGSG